MDLPELTDAIPEKNIHTVFEVGLVLKGVNAALEIIGGIVAAIIPKMFVVNAVLKMTQEELLEDPKDSIASFFLHSAQSFSITSKTFVAIYLLSHGIVKLFLVFNLLKDRRWAYPLSLVVFGLFVIYQTFRFFISHSPWFLFLTIFDLTIIWLTWHEWRYKLSVDAVISSDK